MDYENNEEYTAFSSDAYVHVVGMMPSLRCPELTERVKIGIGILLGTLIGKIIGTQGIVEIPAFLMPICFTVALLFILSGIAKALTFPVVAVLESDKIEFLVDTESGLLFSKGHVEGENTVVYAPLLKNYEGVYCQDEEYIITGKPSKTYEQYILRTIRKELPIWNINYVEFRLPKTEQVQEKMEMLFFENGIEESLM